MTTATAPAFAGFTPAQSEQIHNWIEQTQKHIVSGLVHSGEHTTRSAQALTRSIAAKGYQGELPSPRPMEQAAFALGKVQAALAGDYSVREARMHTSDVQWILAQQIVVIGQDAVKLIRLFAQLYAAVSLRTA